MVSAYLPVTEKVRVRFSSSPLEEFSSVGPVRSGRFPVTEENMGSNPIQRAMPKKWHNQKLCQFFDIDKTAPSSTG